VTTQQTTVQTEVLYHKKEVRKRWPKRHLESRRTSEPKRRSASTWLEGGVEQGRPEKKKALWRPREEVAWSVQDGEGNRGGCILFN